MSMTEAMVIHETGAPEVMRWEEIALGEPGSGEVLLRQTVVGFNMIDTYRRKGLYPGELPLVTGSEAVGVVEALGPDVTTLQIGDRVVYATPQAGAYCVRRVMRAADLVRLPDDISDDVAAASFLKGLTVWFLIHKTWPLQAGETILVYAAAGGVGTLLCQWASRLGARVIGVVGSDAKAAVAREHGCDEVINYTSEEIVPRVRELTGGRGVDVVYDSLGQATFAASLDSLRPRGLLVSYGNATGAVTGVEVLDLMRKGSLFLTRPTLFHYVADRPSLEEGAAALFEAIREGVIRIVINQEFPLREAVAAHRAVESRATIGATLLRV